MCVQSQKEKKGFIGSEELLQKAWKKKEQKGFFLNGVFVENENKKKIEKGMKAKVKRMK